jgi:hypothetical protein
MLCWLLTSGCVAVHNTRNYEPQDGSTQSAYYDCFREAQQGYSSANVNATPTYASGSAKSTVGTNDDLLCACMAGKGYSLRNPTTTETVMGITTSPLWVPFGVLVSMGEGMSGAPPTRWIGCP